MQLSGANWLVSLANLVNSTPGSGTLKSQGITPKFDLWMACTLHQHALNVPHNHTKQRLVVALKPAGGMGDFSRSAFLLL